MTGHIEMNYFYRFCVSRLTQRGCVQQFPAMIYLSTMCNFSSSSAQERLHSDAPLNVYFRSQFLYRERKWKAVAVDALSPRWDGRGGWQAGDDAPVRLLHQLFHPPASFCVKCKIKPGKYISRIVYIEQFKRHFLTVVISTADIRIFTSLQIILQSN